jgi:hypothetical protein
MGLLDCSLDSKPLKRSFFTLFNNFRLTILLDLCMGCLRDVSGNIHIPRRLVELITCEILNFI